MTDYYYKYDDEGDLIPHEYQRGDIVSGIKGTLPMGRYSTIDGLLIRMGDAIGASHYGGSDSLGEGVKGVFNPADGKTYDSKSAYYNAVKAKGLVIDDSPTPRTPAPKLNPINWEKAVKETFSNQKKGKKK
jgi:hypothetical protein